MSLPIKPEISFSVRNKKPRIYFDFSVNLSQTMCHANQVDNFVKQTQENFVTKSGIFSKMGKKSPISKSPVQKRRQKASIF